LAPEVDLVIPLDVPVFGEQALVEGSHYIADKLFHQSALYSLAVDSLGYHINQGGKGMEELRDLIP
jgi:hypothetical protein